MVETFICALIFSGVKFDIKFWRIKISKESYSITPILNRWSIRPIFFMSGVYIYLQSLIFQHNYWFLPYQPYIKDGILLSYMILGVDVLLRNEKYKQYIIACVSLLFGFLLNYIVMYFNQGKMPVFPSFSWATGYTQYDMIANDAYFKDFHVLGDHLTKLIPLCDIFDFGTSIWSLGDVFCRLFAFIIVYYSAKTLAQNIKTNK